MCVIELDKVQEIDLVYRKQITCVKDKLIKCRVDKDITQRAISKLLGTTPSAISRFEQKGYEAKTSLKFFSRYASAVGMSLTVSVSYKDHLLEV